MKQFRRAFFPFSLIVGVAFSTQAQQTPVTANATAPTSLTPARWKAVEGYYQSASNKSLYIQAIAHDSVLLVKIMWMKSVDTLRPLSDLVFIPKNQSGGKAPRTVFVMDSHGTAISNNYSGFTWNKVTEYKPVAMKVMPHTPAQLARFAGIYHSQKDSNDLLQIAVEGNDLVLKVAGNPHLVPQSELSFYRPDNLWFSVDFSKDSAGNITRALEVTRYVWIRNPDPAITPAQLHSYEGKYRAKNDSDNMIQLIGNGNQLLIKQLWDGKSIEVTPLSDLYFYNKAQSYSLQLIKDGDGKVSQAWLFNGTEFDRIFEN
jgi:hypothetical protein